MKLFEHPDFEQAILKAAEYFQSRGLRPAIIEKDYHVTEALRALSEHAGDKIIFKGGTSLLKGWNLIGRFSEDIDIFLDPLAFQPSLGKKAIDRELKRLRDIIGAHPSSPSSIRKARPSADSDATTDSHMCRDLVDRAKLRHAYCWRPAPPVAANPPRQSNCVPTCRNFSPRKASPWRPTMKARSQ